jgi:hypothetical protein
MRSNTSVIKNVCQTAGEKMHNIYVMRCKNEISKEEAFHQLNEIREGLMNLLEKKKDDMTVTSKKRLNEYISLANSYIQKVG